MVLQRPPSRANSRHCPTQPKGECFLTLRTAPSAPPDAKQNQSNAAVRVAQAALLLQRYSNREAACMAGCLSTILLNLCASRHASTSCMQRSCMQAPGKKCMQTPWEGHCLPGTGRPRPAPGLPACAAPPRWRPAQTRRPSRCCRGSTCRRRPDWMRRTAAAQPHAGREGRSTEVHTARKHS